MLRAPLSDCSDYRARPTGRVIDRESAHDVPQCVYHRTHAVALRMAFP